MTRPRRLQILPGFGLSLGMSLLFVALVLLLPLSGLAINLAQLSLADYWNIVSDGQTLAALRVTFWAAAWASLFNALFGLLLAWVLTRYRFPGRGLIDALVDLPFALPTAVAGIALATLFAQDGWLGQPLAALGIAVAYQPAGIVVAMIFTSIPFVVRAVQPVLEALPPAVEEAATTLGARPHQVFTRAFASEIASSRSSFADMHVDSCSISLVNPERSIPRSSDLVTTTPPRSVAVLRGPL